MAVPLNTLRAFALVVRTGSVSSAGTALGISHGAVSHQIRRLEEALGLALFSRTPSGLKLTSQGQQLAERVIPALEAMNHALDDLQRDANDVAIRAPLTLALRWLIPGLEGFRSAHPKIRIRVETTHLDDLALDANVDVSILRLPSEMACPSTETWIALAEDLRSPFVAPRLVRASLTDLRVLRAQPGDWTRWCAVTGRCGQGLQEGDIFDTEDAALHAAVAGLGVVLASPLITGPAVTQGLLAPMPGEGTCHFGRYWLNHHSAPRRQVRQFCRWACATAAASR